MPEPRRFGYISVRTPCLPRPFPAGAWDSLPLHKTQAKLPFFLLFLISPMRLFSQSSTNKATGLQLLLCFQRLWKREVETVLGPPKLFSATPTLLIPHGKFFSEPSLTTMLAITLNLFSYRHRREWKKKTLTWDFFIAMSLTPSSFVLLWVLTVSFLDLRWSETHPSWRLMSEMRLLVASSLMRRSSSVNFQKFQKLTTS